MSHTAPLTLFAALEARGDTVIGHVARCHRRLEFRQFLDIIDVAVPAALDLHLILDDYATHKTPAIKHWFLRPRFHLHFTPTVASWLNLVECWFATLTRKTVASWDLSQHPRTPGRQPRIPNSGH